jgi:hypothetical protein
LRLPDQFNSMKQRAIKACQEAKETMNKRSHEECVTSRGLHCDSLMQRPFNLRSAHDVLHSSISTRSQYALAG